MLPSRALVARADGRAWRRRPARRFVLVAALAVAFVGAVAALAFAGGADPAITLSQPAGGALFGDTQTVTLTAANPSSQTDWGYNLSYEATLPANVTYVATTSPGAPAPTVLAGVPSAGETTLLWQNVADLSPGSSNTLSFTVSHSTTAFAPGDTYQINSGAYVNTDPRQVPQFSTSTGAVVTTTETGSATSSATYTISALSLSTAEPSPEGKLLRGVHDHRTVYTLTVTNNDVKQTTGVTITEYLPADLEYLGCGTGDNTTDAGSNPGSTLEYAGAAALNAGGAPGGLTNCVTPTSVSTVSTTPPGASSAGVYTVVSLPVGTLAAGQSEQLQFVAGVPLRANTTTWSNGTPTGIAQEANLDNNSGPPTYHGEDATVYGQAAGNYNNVTPVTADSSLSRTIMDIRVLKSSSSGSLAEGQDTQWTLTTETGEYRYFPSVALSDTVPNGLCPIDFSPPTTSDPECQATSSADDPSLAWSNTPSEQANGTWILDWTLPSTLAPDATYVITFHTKTRTTYRQAGADTTPIAADDSLTNNVALTSQSDAKCIDGDNECSSSSTKIDDTPGPSTNDDSDAAAQTAAAPTIEKQIQQSSADYANCTSATYGTTAPSGLAPGDQLCYELTVHFPTNVDTLNPSVTDFLPPNLTYVAGSIRYEPDNTVTPTSTTVTGGTVTSDLGSDVPPGAVFDVVLAGTVAADLASYPAGYLTDNLMKTNFANTPGVTVPNRADSSFTLSAPSIDLVKGVAAYTPPGGATVTESGPGVSGVTVPGGSTVEWRVDIENQGGQSATGETWDYLPAGLTCADVSSISNGGTCVSAATDYIDWTGLTLGANTTIASSNQTTLTYNTDIGTAYSPGQSISSQAGVRTFTTTDNQGHVDSYYPQANIDPSVTGGQENAPAADSTAGVKLTGVGFSHLLTTTVNQSGNAAVSLAPSATATIGEDVTYTDTLTVPPDTTLYADPAFGTSLASTLSATTSVSSSYAVNGTPTAMPAGWSTSSAGASAVSLAYGAGGWTNTSGFPETFTLTYTANVLQSSSNVKGDSIGDTATLAYQDESGANQSDPVSAAVTVVEPSIGALLTNNAAGGVVTPGTTYTYTAKLTNSNTAHVATANDNTMVVNVPAGLTPYTLASGGSAVSDGGSVNGWTWSQSARTLTYNGPANVSPGGADTYSFYLNVDSPAVSGSSYTATLTNTTTSYPGTPPNGTERSSTTTPSTGYIATKNDTVTLGAPALTKGVSPTTSTFGSNVVYTVTVSLAANVTYYDLTLLDTIPSGITYDGSPSLSCSSGCTGVGDTPTLATTNSSGATVAFYVSVSGTSIPESSNPRTLTLTFDGHVNSSAVDGTTHTNNSINVYDDTTNKDGGTWPSSPPAAGSFDQAGTAQTAATTIVEPALSITKSVSGNVASGEIAPGDSPTYSLVVHDTSGSWPIYNVVVSDTPSGAYSNVQVASGISTTDITTAWSTPGSTITWTIPTIPAGGSVTLSYTATLEGSSSLQSGQAIDNSASVTSSSPFDTNGDGLHNGYTPKSYTAGPSPVDLTVALPVVTLTDNTGAAGFPNSANAEVGQPFVWRLVVSNSQAPTAASVAIIDTIPAGYTYTPGSATLDGTPISDPSISGQTLDFPGSDVPALADGASHVLEFTTTPTTSAEGQTQPQSNVAYATWKDANGSSSSASGPYRTANELAYGNLILPILSVTKDAATPDVDAGSPTAYTITVSNTGAAPARNVVVTDTLPSGESYSAGSASAVPSSGFSETSETAPNLSWQVAQIDPGDSVTITLPITLAGTLDASQVLTNGVSVTSGELTTPVTANAPITTERSVDVSLTKSGPPSIDAGQSVTWTLDAHNAGPSDARAVQITDAVPSGTTFLAADSGCSDVGGTVTCVAGTLAAGDDAIFHLTATIDSGTTGQITNTASVTTSDPNTAQSSATTASQTVNIGNAVDLAITDTSAAPVIAQTLDDTFTLAVTDNGPSDAYSATVVDTLPNGLTFISASPSQGTCAESGQVVTCQLGTVPVGSNPTIAIVVQGTSTGQFTNTATVSTALQTDTNPANNTATAPLSVVLAANLALTKTGPATITPGMDATYDFAVTDNGPANATGVTLTDQLPAGVTFISASSGCTDSGTTLTCAIGSLADGAAAQASVTVLIPTTLGLQSLSDTASVSADQQNLAPSAATASFTTVVGRAGKLAISKRVNRSTVRAGQTVSYTIVVSAQIATVSNVTICDPLPRHMVYATTPGAPLHAGAACWVVAAITPGKPVTEHVSDRVELGASGKLLNTASASAPGIATVRAHATVTASPSKPTAGGGVTG